MKMVGHHHIGKKLKSFVGLTITDTVKNDVDVFLASKHVHPPHNRECDVIKLVRLGFVFGRHDLKVNHNFLEKTVRNVGEPGGSQITGPRERP